LCGLLADAETGPDFGPAVAPSAQAVDSLLNEGIKIMTELDHVRDRVDVASGDADCVGL
jgi:hypothetical protein